MAGIVSNDRKLGAEVRRLGLNKVKRIFEQDESTMTVVEKKFHDDLLLKLAPGFLPRITEVTGEDGGAVVIQLSKDIAEKNVINSSTGDNSQEQGEVSSS